MPGPTNIEFQGPILIGTMINIVLFGIMIAQVCVYYTSFNRRDKLSLKLFVIAVFLIDAVNTVFDVVYIFERLILHFGDIKYLEVPNWRDAMDPALTGIISLMVQMFFVWRIYKLTRNWLLVAIGTIPTLASGGCAVVTAWETLLISELSEFHRFHGVVIAWLSCAAAADITITTVLIRHLWRWKTDTTNKASHMLIDHIILVTVQTGLITSVVATINLAIFLTKNSPGLHILFNFALCKLYSNSLMGNLNSRVRSKDDDVNHSTIEIAFREQSRGQPNERDNTISSC